MFSDFAVWYLFLAGTASGSFVFAAYLDFSYAASARTTDATLAPRIGFGGSALILTVAACMLFLDLGNPGAISFALENPFRSLVSLGAWLVGLGVVVFGAVAATAFLRLSEAASRALKLAGCVLAVGIMGYTGVLLASMDSVDFWHTPLLVVLFILSALGCGCGYVCAATFAIQGSTAGLSGLRRAGIITSVAEAFVLAAFIASRWVCSDAARQSCSMLLFGDWSVVFWLGLVLCGIVAPLAIAALERWVFVPALRLIDGCAVLVGGLCLRYCVVNVALYSAIRFVVS